MEVYKKVGVNLVLDAMPESEIAQISARGDQQSDDRWWLGDIANMWVDRVRQRLLPCSVLDIDRSVAYLYGDLISARSVRGYREMCRFFEPWMRQEYDVLPWSHFDLAKRYGQDDWQTVLETSVEYMEHHNGKRPSARWLEEHFSGNLTQKIEQEIHDGLPDDWEAEIQTVGDVVTYDVMVADAEGGRNIGGKTLQALIGTIDLMLSNRDRIPVGNELKDKLDGALVGLRGVLKEIMDTL